MGSNCVLIERGTVTPYYQCIGCDVRMAMGCVNDLRANRSENVDSTCTMGAVNEEYGGAGCCPKFKIDPVSGRGDLLFMGSAYPQTLRCISSVGKIRDLIISFLSFSSPSRPPCSSLTSALKDVST